MMNMTLWNYAGMGSRGFYDAWMGSWLGIFLLPLVVWSIFWKGWALWKSARSGSTAWFIILLLLNTAGILEIIYIFLVARSSAPSTSKAKSGKKKK